MTRCTRVLGVLLAGVLTMGISACSGQTQSQQDATEATATQEADGQTASTGDTQAEERAASYTITFGEAKVEQRQYSDDNVLVVPFTFGNDSDKTISANGALSIEAYQDGVSLNTGVLSTDEGMDMMDKRSRNVKPGSSVDVGYFFNLDNLTSPVEVEVYQIDDSDNPIVTTTVNITQ